MLEILSELTDADLKELGLSFGQRRRLMKALRQTPSQEKQTDPKSQASSSLSNRAERRQLTLVAADSPSSFLDDGPTSNLIRQILGAVSEFDKAWLRPSHPNDFNHTFQWLAELTGKAGRVVPSST